MKYLKYLKYILKHKWYVFLECKREKLIWLGITHDLSKFLPSEFIPYANHFYGEGRDIKTGRDATGYYRAGDSGESEFDFAWLLHQKRNRHHWQYWILPMGDGTEKLFNMPYEYRVEMLCDWKGAGKAQNSNLTVLEWYEKNKDKMRLSSYTETMLECHLKRGMKLV